ncbi:MAG: cyclase family protein [Actinobacteria bacterium]|nr:cyclase family protein [Actinomycetota bacterium]
MKIIDASGPIYEGMWSYGPPFPEFKLVEIESPEWVDFTAYSQAFEGFCMLTGTYISGPGHALGLKKAEPMHKTPLEKLFDVDAYVLKFNLYELEKEGNRPYITLKDIKNAEKEKIPDGSNIVIATGWGNHWSEPDFLTHDWFMKKDAVKYIVDKDPFILAMDTPSIDNIDNEQGIWSIVFSGNIHLVAPLVNLDKITKYRVKLYICPLNILNTAGLPCRVIIKEE